MVQPFSVYYHAQLQDDLCAKITPNPGVPSRPDEPYYILSFGLGDLAIFLSDEQRRQLLVILSSAPPLPKSDAQIDAEAEEARGELPDFQHQLHQHQLRQYPVEQTTLSQGTLRERNAISPEVER